MSLLKKEVNQYLLSLKQGDMNAFEKLYNATVQHLIIIARNNLSNKSYIEEVLDDVYLKVIQYINSFDHEKDGYNWMCKITENVAKTYNNKNSKNTVELERVILQAEDKLENVEFTEDIEKAISSLDNISRKIFYYYYYRGLSYTEVAKLLNCHRTNICYHIKKIKRALKNYFFK